MTTLEPSNLRRFATAWESAIDGAERRNDAATFSGIVGDLAHRASGGYHISREDQVDPNNYSVVDCPADQRGRSDLASAVDMNMIDRDMILVYGRLYRSWRDRTDPRLDVCRGINGTLDGQNAIRIDCQFMTEEWATADHLWHIHLEVLRQFADDASAHSGVLSVIVGETVAQWRGVAPVATSDEGEEDQMIRFEPGFACVGDAVPDRKNWDKVVTFPVDPGPGQQAYVSVSCDSMGHGGAQVRVGARSDGEDWAVSLATTDDRRVMVAHFTKPGQVSLARSQRSATDTLDDAPLTASVRYLPV